MQRPAGPPVGQGTAPAGRDLAAFLPLLAAGVGLAFLGFMLAATDGHFVPQVVDLYLTCQYARAMAEGHPFQYNPGEPPSTGATSLLHTSVLAVAHALGVRGEGLVAFAILLGLGLYIASVPLARRIGTRLATSREGALAATLVALGGPVVWGFLYGADVALFMFLCLWLLERLLAGWGAGSFGGAVVAATLIALCRPEGLLIALLLGIALAFGPARRSRGRARLLPWIPSAAGVAVLVLYRAVTGSWMGTSIADKSLVGNYGWPQALAVMTEYGIDVLRGLLLGFYPSQAPIGLGRGWASLFFPPLGLFLVMVGLLRASPPLRTPLGLWLGIVAVLFAALAGNVYLGAHFHRYVLWAFPTLLAVAAAGLGLLTPLLARGDEALQRSLFAAAAVLFVGLSFLSTLRFAVIYGELAGEVYRRDLSAAQWISRNLPPGASVANLATSVEYLTGHRSVNLHGVTSAAFSGNRAAEREAGVLEALGRLPVGDRPPYLITTVAAQETHRTLHQLVAAPPLFRSTGIGDEIEIYRTRFDLLGRNAAFYLLETQQAVRGLQEVDRLNVCDSRDEAAHGYAFRSRLGHLQLNGAARLAAYESEGAPGEPLADAGRAILGRESFKVRTVPGRDLIIVLRTAAVAEATVLSAAGSTRLNLEFPEAGLVVTVDGRQAGRLSFRPRAGWDEILVRVAAPLLSREQTALELSGRYASFFYWFYQ